VLQGGIFVTFANNNIPPLRMAPFHRHRHIAFDLGPTRARHSATAREITVSRLPILILAACALAAAPAAAEPTSSTPAQGKRAKDVRSYRYVYYPTQQIYYATEQQIWFWMNGNSWNFGVDLPDHHRARMGTGVPLRLATTRPFAEHAYVERRYGQPWREKHGRTIRAAPVKTGAHEAATRKTFSRGSERDSANDSG
jgi:hypothetical protein